MRVRVAADGAASPVVRIALENPEEPEEVLAERLEAKLARRQK